MKAQWIWMGLGIAMAAAGGVLKLFDMSAPAVVFEWHFFAGWDYILLATGMLLVIISLGHDILFDEPEAGE